MRGNCGLGGSRRIPALVFLVVMLPLAATPSADPLAGQEPPESQEPQEPPRQLHPEARDAISKIRSPYCPGQMLEACPSLDARILRDSLDRMAWRGLPADSLVELVVAAHGEEYRALPKRTGTGLLAWVMPPAALIAGLGLVVLALRRLKGPDPGGAGTELSEEDRDRIAAALAELEELEGSE